MSYNGPRLEVRLVLSVEPRTVHSGLQQERAARLRMLAQQPRCSFFSLSLSQPTPSTHVAISGHPFQDPDTSVSLELVDLASPRPATAATARVPGHRVPLILVIPTVLLFHCQTSHPMASRCRIMGLRGPATPLFLVVCHPDQQHAPPRSPCWGHWFRRFLA